VHVAASTRAGAGSAVAVRIVSTDSS